LGVFSGKDGTEYVIDVSLLPQEEPSALQIPFAGLASQGHYTGGRLGQQGTHHDRK